MIGLFVLVVMFTPEVSIIQIFMFSYIYFNHSRPGEGVYGEQHPSWDEVEQAL